MDLKLTPEQEAFRQEVRSFLDKELPSDWMGGPISFAYVDRETEMKWRKMLAEKGWNTMGWPKEYGGQGASPMMQTIFLDEWYYRGAPGLDTFGLELLGPTLMIHGTEEQKREHLAGIARGEVVWCQGFSEPESGSDLASLQTRAVEDGDDYIISGQKIWSSYAQYADRMFLLARTDPEAPKHRGITFFLLDMKTPGITVRPIQEMTGESSFNEEFFDSVRVPKANIVGEVNRGWYVAMTTLNFEREGITYTARARKPLDLLIDYVRETRLNGTPLARDPAVQHKLAEMVLETEVSRLLSYRIAWLVDQGQEPQHESSICKLFSSELLLRVANAGMQILGLSGQLVEGDKWAPLKGRLQRMYLWSVSEPIGGGTSEIQRNIIATRGLGLPRAA
ncbi:MAG: acyl-CoA dehydrogenase [Chloroflexi bacterium]|nr:acyl-CoA dehydrogenase [Chloroflexota bacterium]